MPVRKIEPLIALVCYAAITLVFLLPILSRLADEIIVLPGLPPADHLQAIWNGWWMKRSALHGANPFFTDALFVPYGTPLVFHNLTPIQSTVMAMLSWRLGTELSYNLVVIAGLPFAGMCAYALCRQVTRHHLASLIGGLAFMLSPVIVSRAAGGWLNVLYAGALPLYTACLLRCISSEPSSSRSSRWWLAGSALLVLLTDPVVSVFAANITACVFVWQCWSTRAPGATVARFARALAPSALVATPYLVMFAYYVVAFGFSVDVGRRLNYVPEFLSFVLPFNPSSLYSTLLDGMNLSAVARVDFARIDTACYLGLLVFPLSITGFIVGRRNPLIRLMMGLFALFLILALGPKLLWMREIVHVGPLQVRLPFALWQLIPILGDVAQPGRYLVIAFMAMSVGVACAAEALMRKFGDRNAWLAVGLMALLICTDYAFRFDTARLPPVPVLSGQGVVLDPRLRNGAPMYYQTRHEQPLMGGYVARRPEFALRGYLETQGFACLFVDDPQTDCDRTGLLSSLRSAGVTDICLDPGDARGGMLARYGFREHYADRWTVVWSVPRETP